MSRKALFAVFIFLAYGFFVAAQTSPEDEENLDNLFDDPPADTIAVDVGIDHRTQYEQSQGIKFSGSFSITSGLAAGWTGLPQAADLSRGFAASAGLLGSSILTMDVRPDSSFRVYGSFSTTMNPLMSSSTDTFINTSLNPTASTALDSTVGNKTWSGIVISELFCDYTLLEKAYFRIGKFPASWGQGRLFAPGNFTENIGDSFAVRATLPAIFQGISGLVFINPGYVVIPGDTDALIKELVYLAKADFVVKNLLLGVSARYLQTEGFKGLLSLKTAVRGVDILTDAVFSYVNEVFSWKVMAGFFKDWDDVQLYGEYFYNQGSGLANDHRTGLVLGFKHIFESTMNLGLKHEHAFTDNSGSFTVGLTYSPWSHIALTMGLPVTYGKEGSVYANANADPAKRRIALGLQCVLSASY